MSATAWKGSSSPPSNTTRPSRSTSAPARRSRSATSRRLSRSTPGTAARSAGTQPSRTASHAASSTPPARRSSSASGLGYRCVRGSSARWPGTAPSAMAHRTARRALALARAACETLARRPRPVLGALIIANVAATTLFALAIPHNGWVWYQGGDQIAYATDGSIIAGIHLPPADLGYGLPLLLAPVSRLVGPAYTQML